jgi:hypothetical protein
MNAKLSKMWNEAIIALARVCCHDLAVNINGGLDWMIGFIETRDYRQYSATVISTHVTVHRYTRIIILSLH